jgi:hypothetical protein
MPIDGRKGREGKIKGGKGVLSSVKERNEALRK